MHDEHSIDASTSNDQATFEGERYLMELVGKHLQYSSTLVLESLTHILLAFPEEYQSVVMQTIAEHFVNTMRLHMLSLVAQFYRLAEAEGISTEDRDQTLQDIGDDMHSMTMLNQQLTITTVEDLFRLGKITRLVRNLSQCTTADEAQGWLYNLLTIYQGRLAREHLIRNDILPSTTRFRRTPTR